MLYKDHVEKVCSSLMEFANNKETDLILLKNHLLLLVDDVSIEADKTARLYAQAELLQKYEKAIKTVIDAEPTGEEDEETLLRSLKSYLQGVLDNNW